jgi:hypothetical protein
MPTRGKTDPKSPIVSMPDERILKAHLTITERKKYKYHKFCQIQLLSLR